VGDNVDLLCDTEKLRSLLPAQNSADLENACVDCTEDYDADTLLHDHQRNLHSEDMALDMVHADGSGVAACVLDRHPAEEEDTAAAVRIPMIQNQDDHMDNARVDGEDEALVVVGEED
jgi:hypothetical protein